MVEKVEDVEYMGIAYLTSQKTLEMSKPKGDSSSFLCATGNNMKNSYEQGTWISPINSQWFVELPCITAYLPRASLATFWCILAMLAANVVGSLTSSLEWAMFLMSQSLGVCFCEEGLLEVEGRGSSPVGRYTDKNFIN